MTKTWTEHFIICYLFDEDTHGEVLQLGAHVSLVKYSKDGIEYEEYMDNDNFIVRQDIVIQHEEED